MSTLKWFSLNVPADVSRTEPKFLTYSGNLNVRGDLVLTGDIYKDGVKTSLIGKDSLPVGSIIQYPEEFELPEGYLRADGSVISKLAPYVELYRIVGTTFGPETSTEFKLPTIPGHIIKAEFINDKFAEGLNWTSIEGSGIYYVASNGNTTVGIGTTNPNPLYALDVNGNINFTGQLLKNGVEFAGSGGGSGWNVETGRIYTETSKVGIGTEIPRTALHIRDPTASIDITKGLRIGSSSSFTSINHVNRFSGTDYLYIQGTTVVDDISVSFNNDILLNPNGGRVGVGTTTANYRLDVNGDINLSGDLRINGQVILSASDQARPNWSSLGSDLFYTGGNVGIGTIAGSNRLTVDGNTNLLSLSNAYRIADNDVLTRTTLGNTVVNSSLTSVGTLSSLNVTGNVGIGTTQPSFKLDIFGDINVRGNILKDGFTFTGGGPWTEVGGVAVVTSSRVGINTNFPLANLDVFGSSENFSRDSGIKVGTNNSFGMIGLISGGQPTLSIQGATNFSTDVNITLNALGGNVGIGTTAPQTVLHVGGSLRVDVEPGYIWTTLTIPELSTDVRFTRIINGEYLIGSQDGKVFFSSDGIGFTMSELPSGFVPNDISRYQSFYFVCGNSPADGPKIYYSQDKNTWEPMLEIENELKSFAFFNNQVYVVGSGDFVAYYPFSDPVLVETRTWDVSNNNDTSYTFSNYSSGENISIEVDQGTILVFNIDSTGQPFWIKSEQITGIDSAVTTGLTDNGIEQGTITWDTTNVTPGTYYYISENESSMTGTIVIVGPPQETRIWDVSNNNDTSYTFSNYSSGENISIEAVQGTILVFNIDSTGQPFWIKEEPVTGIESAVTTGLTTNGIESGTISWDTTNVFPGTYYYISENEEVMVGTIVITEPPIEPEEWKSIEVTGDWNYVYANTQKIYIVGNQAFAQSVDGEVWDIQTTGLVSNLLSVAANETDIVLVGEVGTIFVYDAGEEGWVSRESGVISDLIYVAWIEQMGSFVIFGSESQLIVSSDALSWEPMTIIEPMTSLTTAVWDASLARYLVGGPDGQLATSDSSHPMLETRSTCIVTSGKLGVNNFQPMEVLDVGGNVNVSEGSVYKIGGEEVLSSTTLGTTVINSSLTTVGTLSSLTVSGNTILQGDLTILGTQTIVNTEVETTSRLEVTNNGTGPAAIINQTGEQPIIDIQDDGVSVFYIADGGNLGLGTTEPSEKLDVVGNVLISGDLTVDTDVLVVDSTDNRVGVNNASPAEALDVVGNVLISGDLTVDTDVLVVDSTDNRVGVNNASPAEALDVVGNVLISGDLTVDTDVLVVDSTDNRVGVNNASPAEALDVVGNVLISGDLTVDTDVLVVDSTDNRVGVNNASPAEALDVVGNVLISGDLTVDTDVLVVDSTDNRVGVNNASPAEALDVVGNVLISGDLTVDTDVLVVDSTDNRVGVNNASPAEALDVVGNVLISGDLTVDTDVLVVDSTDNRVGVNTASPTETLTVYGTSNVIRPIQALWSETTIGSSDVTSIGFNGGAGVYFAVNSDGDFLTSTGTTWSDVPISAGFVARDVLYNVSNSLYVAVGSSSGSDPKLYTSPDGIVWTGDVSISSPLTTITSNSTLILAAGPNVVVYSTDGTAWTTLSLTGDWNSVSWSGLLDLFLLVGDNGALETSPDGIVWTTGTSGTIAHLRSVASSSTSAIIVGDSGTILTSTDGILWTVQPSGTMDDLFRVAHNPLDGNFLIGGQNGKLYSYPPLQVSQVFGYMTDIYAIHVVESIPSIIVAGADGNGSLTLSQTVMRIGASDVVIHNRVGINTDAPAYTLDVVGDARVTGNFTFGNATMYYKADTTRLGINVDEPTVELDILGKAKITSAAGYALEVAGNINFSGGLFQNGIPFVSGGGGGGGDFADSLPVGAFVKFPWSATIPDGYLKCDGAEVSRAEYAQLFAVIGTDYGVGDGVDTFNLPTFYDHIIKFRALGGTTTVDYLPIGSVITLSWVIDPYPSGWLKCDGSEVSRTEYSQLFAAVGTDYGEGDGATTFELPTFFNQGIKYRTTIEGGIADESYWTPAPDSSLYNMTNVGIGTTQPQSKLHVEGDILIAGNLVPGTDVQYDLGTPTSSFRDLYLSGTTIFLGDTKISTDAITGDITFRDKDTNDLKSISSSNTQNIIVTDGNTIFTSGNVGIGTTDPTDKLHVVGNLFVDGNLTVSGTQSQVVTKLEITNEGTGPAILINQTGAQPVANFQDDGTSVLFIADGGNVGLGTITPSSKLQVQGSVRVNGGEFLQEGISIGFGSSTVENIVSTSLDPTKLNNFISYREGPVDIKAIEWVTRVNGTGSDEGRGVAPDSSGNVYVVGYYASDPLTIFNADGSTFGTLSNSGTSSAFLVKYNSLGTVQWVARMHGPGQNEGWSVATDSSGNVYVSGSYTDTLTLFNADTTSFGTLTLSGSSGAFLVKYDSNGFVQWGTKVDGTGVEIGRGIATDPTGNVYFTGSYTDTVTIFNADGNSFGTLTNSGASAVFVVKYSSSGTAQWRFRVDGAGSDEGYGIATDLSGNVYVTGYYQQTVTFFNANASTYKQLLNSGGDAVFVAKYNTSGSGQWVTRLDGGSDERGLGIATDPSGNVYVTGYYNSSPLTIRNENGTSFGTLSNPGFNSVFIVKFSTAGVAQWATRLAGSTGNDEGYGIASDALGNVYVTGKYIGTVTVSNADTSSFGTLISEGGSQAAFIVKYNASGVAQWATRADGPGTDSGYGIATDALGNVYVTGSYTDSLTLYQPDTTSFGTLTTSGGLGGFVMKINDYVISEIPYDLALLSNTTANQGRSITVVNQSPTASTVRVLNSVVENIPVLFSRKFLYYNNKWYSADGSDEYRENITITDGGNVGIGTTTPTEKLQVEGSVRINGGEVIQDGISIGFGSSTVSDIIGASLDPTKLYNFVTSRHGGEMVMNEITEWALRVDGKNTEVSNAVATDTFGNVYMTGYYSSDPVTIRNADGTAFRTLAYDGSQIVFVVKYSSSGRAQWAIRIDGAGADDSNGIATDAGGNFYVTGYYTGSATFYNSDGTSFGTLSASSGSTAAFIIKYNTSGVAQWTTQIDGGSNDIGYAITTDSNGNVYVTGSHNGTVSVFNSDGTTFGTLANSGGASAFVVKYNTSGTAQWATRVDGTGADVGYGIATDSDGNVCVTGRFAGTVSFFNADGTTFGTLIASGSNGAFIVKYNTFGAVQWRARVDGSGNDQGYGIDTDSSGNVYVTGFNTGTVTVYNADGTSFGNITADSGSVAVYIAKYNTSGVVQWATRLDGPTTDIATAIAVDSFGNVYITGYYTGTVNVYNINNNIFGTLSSEGSNAVYIVKYNTSGIAQWATKIDGAGDDQGYGIATDNFGNVYVTGFYTSNPITIFNPDGTIFRTLPNSGSNAAFLVKINDYKFLEVPYDLPLLTNTPVNQGRVITVINKSPTPSTVKVLNTPNEDISVSQSQKFLYYDNKWYLI
jgi:microcystin-dependent protein